MSDKTLRELIIDVHPVKKRLEIYYYIKKLEKKAKKGGKNGNS